MAIAVTLQEIAGSDARELENLRCADRPRRHHHLAARRSLPQSAVLIEGDAGHTPAGEFQAMHRARASRS